MKAKSTFNRVHQTISNIFQTDKFDIKVLFGGLTNQNYLITLDKHVYVASIHDQNSSVLGINRNNEIVNHTQAFNHGIAPQIIHSEPGILISEYIEGNVLKSGDIKRTNYLQRVIDALRRCHQIPKTQVSGTYSVIDDIERFTHISRRENASFPDNLDWGMNQLHRIKAAINQQFHGLTFCHNDTVPENMIDQGEHIVLIDWEYSAVGDPYFDLGMLAAYHVLDVEQEQALLRTYFGTVNTGAVARLKLLRILSDLRDWSWALVQTIIATTDFDYARYSDDRWKRFTSACSKPHFEILLSNCTHNPCLSINN